MKKATAFAMTLLISDDASAIIPQASASPQPIGMAIQMPIFADDRRLAAVYEDSHKRSRETKDQGGNHEAEDRADEKGFFGSPADALLFPQLFILVPAGFRIIAVSAAAPREKLSFHLFPEVRFRRGALQDIQGFPQIPDIFFHKICMISAAHQL